MMQSAAPFRILTVCTGNICRSPQAERLLVAGFARRGLGDAVSVGSAGVAALVGEPMPEQAAAQTAAHGGDPSGHVARQLTEDTVAHAELILTMERAHRAEVVRLVPRASRYTFTLPEFARLAVDLRESGESEPAAPARSIADRLRALVPDIAAGRGLSLPSAAEHDEVEDPYRRSDAAYARSATQVAVAVATIVDVLAELSSRERPA